jgi:hypothetical protein
LARRASLWPLSIGGFSVARIGCATVVALMPD